MPACGSLPRIAADGSIVRLLRSLLPGAGAFALMLPGRCIVAGYLFGSVVFGRSLFGGFAVDSAGTRPAVGVVDNVPVRQGAGTAYRISSVFVDVGFIAGIIFRRAAAFGFRLPACILPGKTCGETCSGINRTVRRCTLQRLRVLLRRLRAGAGCRVGGAPVGFRAGILDGFVIAGIRLFAGAALRAARRIFRHKLPVGRPLVVPGGRRCTVCGRRIVIRYGAAARLILRCVYRAGLRIITQNLPLDVIRNHRVEFNGFGPKILIVLPVSEYQFAVEERAEFVVIAYKAESEPCQNLGL